LPQCRLAILELSDRIGDENDVERSPQAVECFGILHVAHMKFEKRMAQVRDIDHCLAEIDAHPSRRLECRKAVADAAAKFKNPETRRHQEGQITAVFLVVIGVAGDPIRALERLAFRA